MVTPSPKYSRRFSEEEQIIVSSCNYCFGVVAESSEEEELEKLENEHWCPQQARAIAA